MIKWATEKFDEWQLAILFLTRLPLPAIHRTLPPLVQATWAFPVVGLLVGGVSGGVMWSGSLLGLSPTVSAIISLITAILLTGGLHEDGLADVADGFGGGRDKAQKLLIMKDSRLGTYGALALILATALKLALIVQLLELAGPFQTAIAWIAMASASRAMIVPLMAVLKPAREEGLALSAGRPTAASVITTLVLAAIVLVLFLGLAGGAASWIGMSLAAGILAILAKKQIGGQTGDVLGAAQVVSELAGWLFLVLLLVSG